MFDLRSESVKTFINDTTIQLPRFQRKQTWGSKKNFKLALSLFRGYPIGVVVIKREGALASSGIQKYLLDGRQRRAALTQLGDPEEVYSWARDALKLKQTDTADIVTEKFRVYIEDYFGGEEWESADADSDEDRFQPSEESASLIGGEEGEEISAEEMHAEAESMQTEDEVLGAGQVEGLQDLLELILMVHPLRKWTSGFRSPFDFDQHVDGLEFYQTDLTLGRRYISPPSLVAWIDSKRRFGELAGESFPPAKEDFMNWLVAGRSLKTSESALRPALDLRWAKIHSVMRILDALDKRLQESQLGYLEIRDCTANDEKKIFEIINTEGTPLTAAEILSAKPWWNRPVQNPHSLISQTVTELYAEMGIRSDDSVVRWDVPATLMARNPAPLAFGSVTRTGSRGFERSVTLGFQLFSGFYGGRITKNDIASLGKRDDIPWETIELDTKLRTVSSLLEANDHFKFWLSWRASLAQLTSDAVGLNFALLTLKDWINKGSPGMAQTAQLQKVRKNAIILLDRSIYEYATGRWRGSSDSRLANNLLSLTPQVDVMTPVASDSWNRFVDDLIDHGTIDGLPYAHKQDRRIQLLLQYFYALHQFANPGGHDEQVHVDHIIPKKLFALTHRQDLRGATHHIANLQLLPDAINIEKSDKRLREVTGSFARSMIERTSNIPESDFTLFSDPEHLEALKAHRGSILKGVLKEDRVRVLAEGI